MNELSQWCSYLTSEMHEKHGVPESVAHDLVCKWLRSVKTADTSPDHSENKPPQVSVRAKTASISSRT